MDDFGTGNQSTTKRRSLLEIAKRRFSDLTNRGYHHQSLDDAEIQSILPNPDHANHKNYHDDDNFPMDDQKPIPGLRLNESKPKAGRSKSAVVASDTFLDVPMLSELSQLARELETIAVKTLEQQGYDPKDSVNIAEVKDMDSSHLSKWRELVSDAERGLVRAQFCLGGYYHIGGMRGLATNPYRALKWYARAASQGDVPAVNNIGVMLMKGIGLDRDEKQACKWFDYASGKENIYAMVNYGILLTKPNDPSLRDFDKAFPLFYKCAKFGNPIAQNNLGCMLARGYGCDQDFKRAMKYFKRSSANGSAAAKYNMGALYTNGMGVQTDFVRAKDWFDKAASDPHHEEYPYVVADNDPTKFLLLTSIISYRP